MSEQDIEERMDEFSGEQHGHLEQKININIPDIQENVMTNIDKAMSNTASSLDKAAQSFKSAAEFLKEKNADVLKEDFANHVKKHPGKILFGAALLGFIFGRMISR